MMERKKFVNISASNFQHPLDVKAIETLKNVKGLDTVCHKMMEWGYERVQYIRLIANAIMVSKNHFPRLYNILEEASVTLSMDMPNLFIENSMELNAYTSGSENPFIVLTSKLVEDFNEDELRVVIGHELGHIKCRHVVYSSAANFIKNCAEFLSGPSMGLSGLFSMGIELALFNWQRKSELSSDRASLLVSQDLNTCVNVFMKSLEFPPKIANEMLVSEFYTQAELYKDMDSDTLIKIYKLLSDKNKTHPDLIVRMKELSDWAKIGEYQKLLTGDYSVKEIIDDQVTTDSAMIKEEHRIPNLEQSATLVNETVNAVTNIAGNIVKGGLKGFFKK
jgi:Zn-dependent protease with chaperone function